DARQNGRLGLVQARGAPASAHLEREMRGHRIALADVELVIGAGRSPLGFHPEGDAGELQAALPAAEGGALPVADEHDGLRLAFLPYRALHPRPLRLQGARVAAFLAGLPGGRNRDRGDCRAPGRMVTRPEWDTASHWHWRSRSFSSTRRSRRRPTSRGPAT